MPALARFYDPQIGRFLTPDPAGTIDSPNLYAYVLNDPINFTDPSGLCETVTGSRICRSPLTATDTGGIGGDSAGGGGGRGGGGGTRPCTISFGDTVIRERCVRPTPFDPGPAFPISFFDPIFGGGPARMAIPPEISPDPEPGMMMQPEMTSRETCMLIAEAAGGIVGGLAGLVATGALVASAPATVTGFVAVLGATVAAGAIVGTVGYFAAGGNGLLAGSQVGQGALVIGRNAILSSPRAAAAFGASAGGGQVIALASAAAGTIAGGLLGQRFCPRT